MKRLNITNFTKKLMEIYSDFFMIKHCSEDRDKYLIGIEVRDVVSFKPLEPKYYKMEIYKDKSTDSLLEAYELKLWDMGENISYPMSIMPDNISSVSEFTSFLNNTLKVADRGEFSGSNGCMIK